MELEWIAGALEVVGLFLLAREVYRGHKMEEIQRGVEFAKQMNYLYARSDYDGFYIASRLDQGDPPAKAQADLKALGPAAVAQAVQQQWQQLAPRIAASVQRWEEWTTPAAMRGRRISLFVGTALLMVAAIIHAVE